MTEFSIDPQFSVFRLVQRAKTDSSILNHRRAMSMISYEIENATLIDGAKTTIFSSFQRMSKFIPQVERYTALAAKSEHVYVFGEMDVLPPVIDNITYVPLQRNDQLAKEWFIVSYSADYFCALATEEQSDFEAPDPQRVFKGVWTFEVDMVTILYKWLSRIVAAHIEELHNDLYDWSAQAIHIENIVDRMEQRLERFKDQPLHDELQTMITANLHPTLAAMRS